MKKAKEMAKGTAVFLDASVMISRIIHSGATKEHIRKRLEKYDVAVTSLVVKQEFKRRFLKEAIYLLSLFETYDSYEEVCRHVDDVLTTHYHRKQRICVQLLRTFFEQNKNKDLEERAIHFLTYYIDCGLDDFDDSVDSVIPDSGCTCGLTPITKTRRGNYRQIKERCTSMQECGINEWLKENAETIDKIKKYLSDTPDNLKSDEIRNAEAFLNREEEDASAHDPCLTVGDLLVAIESSKIPDMYTMNIKESKHFCKALGQTMVFRSPNFTKDDIVYKSNEEWGI